MKLPAFTPRFTPPYTQQLIGDVIVELHLAGPQRVRSCPSAAQNGEPSPNGLVERRALVDREIALRREEADERVEVLLFLDDARADDAGELVGEVVLDLAEQAVRVGFQVRLDADVDRRANVPMMLLTGAFRPLSELLSMLR